MSMYTVRTCAGITFCIEASSFQEAQQRASSPAISKHISLMIIAAVREISNIELHRGPIHLIRDIVFDNQFFNRYL
jgi:hypothetical protein